MLLTRFTDTVAGVLRAAGWSEGRVAESSRETIAFLEAWCFSVPPSVVLAIQEFDGLNCYNPDTGSSLTFDAKAAMRWSCPDYSPVLEWVIGELVCPIAHGNRMILFLGASGNSVWLHEELSGFAREKDLATGLNTHFTADYSSVDWHELDADNIWSTLRQIRASP